MLHRIFNFSCEFVKGMQDVEGDKKFKIKTIANLHGYKTATIFMVTFSSIGAILFTLMIFFLYGLNIFYMIFIIIADIIVVSLNILLISNPRHSKKAKNIKSSNKNCRSDMNFLALLFSDIFFKKIFFYRKIFNFS